MSFSWEIGGNSNHQRAHFWRRCRCSGLPQARPKNDHQQRTAKRRCGVERTKVCKASRNWRSASARAILGSSKYNTNSDMGVLHSTPMPSFMGMPHLSRAVGLTVHRNAASKRVQTWCETRRPRQKFGKRNASRARQTGAPEHWLCMTVAIHGCAAVWRLRPVFSPLTLQNIMSTKYGRRLLQCSIRKKCSTQLRQIA